MKAMSGGATGARPGGVVTRLPLQPKSYTNVRVSCDGARLALGSDDGKEAIIWIHDLAGSSEPRRLTLQGQNRFPIWSPDGVRIAFQSDREKDLAIFAQRADGTGPIERLTKPGQGDDTYRNNGAGEMLVYSAADYEDFQVERPDMPPSMEADLEPVVRLLAGNRWPWRLHATYNETLTRALNVLSRRRTSCGKMRMGTWPTTVSSSLQRS